MGAALDLLYPGVAFVFIYCKCDMLVESADARIGGIGGAELVTLPYKLFYVVGEVGDGIGNVSSWDIYFGGCLNNSSQLGLPRASRGRWLELTHSLLHRPGEGVPVCFTEVGVGDAGDLGGFRRESTPQVE